MRPSPMPRHVWTSYKKPTSLAREIDRFSDANLCYANLNQLENANCYDASGIVSINMFFLKKEVAIIWPVVTLQIPRFSDRW